MSTRLLSCADFLYRWRWLTSTLFVVVCVGVIRFEDRQFDALAVLAIVTAALLMWVPIAIHWTTAARDSGQAFRDGLAGR